MSQINAANLFKILEQSDEFHIEDAKIGFALELKRAMEREKISKSELAERLSVSRPMVTKLLRGNANVTIETMVKAARRLRGNIFISIVREECSARLFEIVRSEMARPHPSHKVNLSKPLVEKAWDYASNDVQYGASVNETKPVAA